ncbi:MAG: DUF4126 domain-containing protein [Anaerolineales bacterium]|nr:DUF4126 domain-containing protein [Anaerolineales bacterium]
MNLFTSIFSAFGLSASAGLNAYIPLLTVALLARFTDLIELSSPWDTLEDWWVIGTLSVLLLIEFFADKIPAVNHINDIIQTFVRPTAGAIAFAASAGVIADSQPAFSLILGLLVAGGVHAAKSLAIRPAVTATTGGVGNVPISILEDIISTVLSILAIVIPILFAAIAIVITAWFVWWLWRRASRTEARQRM